MELWNYTDYRIEGQHEQICQKTFEQRDTKQEQVLLCNDMELSGPEFCSLAGIILRSHYIIYSKVEVCVDGFVFYSTKERNEFSKLAIKKNSSE